MRQAQENLRVAPGRIPNDSVRLDDDLAPIEAQLWVLKAGISPELASDELGMMWNDRYKRVLVPVRQEVVLARSVHKEIQPKYLLLGASGAEVYFLHRQGDDCVMTEDILSAYRVYQAGYNACAVLGTSLTQYSANQIAQKYARVRTWLDADIAGRKGSAKLRRALSLYPIQVDKVQTEYTCDPKYLSIDQVRGVLG